MESVKYAVSHPEFIDIFDPLNTKTAYGPDQSWFADTWLRRAACGPTSASFIFSYLAHTRPALQPLYIGTDLTRQQFVRQMEAVSDFMRPGPMGVNRIDLYTKGALQFASEHGIVLTPHTFKVNGLLDGWRTDLRGLADFVTGGLSLDTPVALLVLSKGKESRLQDWHWITITEAEFADGKIFATATDEGEKIHFDLSLWYQSTKMSGGLVYFSVAEN